MYRPLALAVTLFTAPVAVAGAQERDILDTWIRGVMADWSVPGVAVGAVKDGEVVFVAGYGYRDVERRLPVTPRTLMAIGSNTKSFTVVLLGQLADSGRLDWNTAVRDYLPTFRLHDDYATANMRVRDLVTHVSGLPRHDALWYGRSYDRASLFSRLQHLAPSVSFRGRYQYQNLMFMTAGYLVEQLTDEPWDARIDERIFTPLGMARSNTSVRDLAADDDVALPYYLDGDSLVRVPYRNIDAIGPAGSINSSVEEMLRYVQMHLDSGRAGDRQILSAEQIAQMQTAQSAVGSRDRYAELGPATYGLAVRLGTYRGHKMVGHGGGIDGFISSMVWLPNERIGVVVLTNRSGEANPVPTIVQQRVLDDLLGLDPIDWNARIRAEWDEGRQQEAEARAKREAERVTGTAPSHALSDYVGTYEHPGYGRIEVTERDGVLRLEWDGDEVVLTHYHYDVFEVRHTGPNTPLEGRLQFQMGMNGTLDRLAVPLEPAVDPIVFRRAGAP